MEALGEGGVDSPQECRLSTCLRKAQDSMQQRLVLAVGLGRNGCDLLIVFGTYCVILEERKGTYQPLIEI